MHVMTGHPVPETDQARACRQHDNSQLAVGEDALTYVWYEPCATKQRPSVRRTGEQQV
jgi:hypothetical protein